MIILSPPRARWNNTLLFLLRMSLCCRSQCCERTSAGSCHSLSRLEFALFVRAYGPGDHKARSEIGTRALRDPANNSFRVTGIHAVAAYPFMSRLFVSGVSMTFAGITPLRFFMSWRGLGMQTDLRPSLSRCAGKRKSLGLIGIAPLSDVVGRSCRIVMLKAIL
jgi:hypothetical protein